MSYHTQPYVNYPGDGVRNPINQWNAQQYAKYSDFGLPQALQVKLWKNTHPNGVPGSTYEPSIYNNVSVVTRPAVGTPSFQSTYGRNSKKKKKKL